MAATFWPAPHCDDCWDKQRPDRLSPREGAGPPEACVLCGKLTISGIYICSELRAKSLGQAWQTFGIDMVNRWSGEGDAQTFTISRTESCLLSYALSGFTSVLLKMEGE